MFSIQRWFVVAALLASSTPSQGNQLEFQNVGLVCVKGPSGDWRLKAVSDAKAKDMYQAGTAVYPGTNGLDFLCRVEERKPSFLRPRQRAGGRRDQALGKCRRTSNGFVLVNMLMAAPTKEESMLMAAPKKDKEQQDGSVEMLPGMNLWEFAAAEIPWPECGSPGQNEPFQGRSLTNQQGVCDKINICHGNAGFGWNRITVARESLGEPTAAGASGHAEEEHNKMLNKRADYFPMTQSVPNPNGAGINGYLDSNCGFVCPDCPPNEQMIPATDIVDDSTTTEGGDTTAGTGVTTGSTTTDTTEAPTTATPTKASEEEEIFLVGSAVNIDGTICILQSDCTCEDPEDVEEDKGTVGDPSGVKGDPHFVMFNGQHFEFHGGCDLVLLDVPNFNSGQGLRVHIRTKIVTFFSYVEQVAVQIGEDVLEVKGGFMMSQRRFFINGKILPHKKLTKEDGLLPITVGGYEVYYETQRDRISWKVSIILPEGQKIALRTIKDYMRVDIEFPKKQYFESAKGLMGTFENDLLLSRDGRIAFEDVNAYGQEWQVRDDDPALFLKPAGAQYPQQCQMPSTWWKHPVQRRRLAENSFTYDDAKRACQHLHQYERNDCISDVIATGDMEIASAY